MYLGTLPYARPGRRTPNSPLLAFWPRLNDNAIEATLQTVSAVRDRFVGGVGHFIAQQGPFTEIPGAKAFVQSLHNSATHRIAYATGGWHDSALLKLTTAGFPMAGVPLATSDDHFDRREIMLHSLRQLGGVFDTVTYYGDGQWDALAAKALGWQFVPVGRRLKGLTEYGRSA